MAKLGVEITGNERDLLRAFKSSERGAKHFDREMGRVTRGALRGSGAFKGLGRSVAFASGAFLGAAGFTEALRASVDAAEEFGKASRSLNAQLRANKENVAGAAPAIEVANLKLAKFGQTAADSEVALSRLDRATGNIRKAIELEGLTANVAAARHISLAQAAILVGKVVQGTTTALNRGGLVIKKGTSVTEALRIATQKFAGQAAASVTPLEKLHASVTNLEVILGEGLLPIINKTADALTEWLSKPVNQARVRKDVNQTAHAFGGLASAIGDVVGLIGKIDSAQPGGKKGLFELIAEGIGAQPFLPRKLREHIDPRLRPAPTAPPGLRGPLGTVSRRRQFIPPGPQGPATAAGAARVVGRTGFTAQGNKFFDAAIGRRLDRVQDVPTLRGQIKTLADIAGLVSRRLKLTKDITRRFTLEDELLGIAREQKSLRAEIAGNQVEAKRLAADKKLAALEKEWERVQRERAKRLAALSALQRTQQKGRAQATARQFAALGLGPTGNERVPTASQLRKVLGTVEGAVKGTVLDTSATRSKLAQVRKVLSGELGKLNADVRAKVKELLDALTPDKAAAEGTLFHKASPNALLAGLGLSADQTRALRGRLSRVGAGGATAGRGSGAFGVPDTQIVVPVSIDGWQVARVVTKRQQTRSRRNPPQKRGPNAGR